MPKGAVTLGVKEMLGAPDKMPLFERNRREDVPSSAMKLVLRSFTTDRLRRG